MSPGQPPGPAVKRLHFELEPGAEPVRRARSAVRTLLLAQGFGPETTERIVLGLDEVVMNACSHGSGPGARVELAVEVHADRACFEVLDRGNGVPARTSGALPDHDAETGRGLFLIRELMDEVSWRPREGGGTVVRLVKRK